MIFRDLVTDIYNFVNLFRNINQEWRKSSSSEDVYLNKYLSERVIYFGYHGSGPPIQKM